MGTNNIKEQWRYTGPGDYFSGIGIFRDEHAADDSIIRARKKKEERRIIIVHNEVLKNYQFKHAKIGRVVLPEEVGLNANFFGGQIKKCATLKDSPYILILNSANETIGLYVMKDKKVLEGFNMQELIDINRGQKLKANKTMKKDELINQLLSIK